MTDDAIKAFGMVIDRAKRQKEGKPPPMACCPSCEEPLIMTFRFPGKEFICVECRGLWGFLDPIAKEITPELNARHDELVAKWEKELSEAKETP
jgi:hypothetical protein